VFLLYKSFEKGIPKFPYNSVRFLFYCNDFRYVHVNVRKSSGNFVDTHINQYRVSFLYARGLDNCDESIDCDCSKGREHVRGKMP